MKVLIYEHVTDAARLGESSVEYPESVRIEGAAMRSAVVADFQAVPGVETLEPAGRGFEECVAAAEAVLLIAPESDGVLAALTRRVERIQTPLLSPSSEFCAWAGDKSAAAERPASWGVPVPRGRRLTAEDRSSGDLAWPVVLKPNDGCGSQGVLRIATRAALDGVVRRLRLGPASAPTSLGSYRLEEFVPGEAVSVALLNGPGGIFALPACRQKLSDDGSFAYLGGSAPLPAPHAGRAQALALKAAAAMPIWRGYIGLDLVLGPVDDGSADYLIEGNPRLTTSYVGLRRLAQSNLAQAMIDVAAGRMPSLEFHRGSVEFTPAGAVTYCDDAPATMCAARPAEAFAT